jgi:hypothetical protein
MSIAYRKPKYCNICPSSLLVSMRDVDEFRRTCIFAPQAQQLLHELNVPEQRFLGLDLAELKQILNATVQEMKEVNPEFRFMHDVRRVATSYCGLCHRNTCIEHQTSCGVCNTYVCTGCSLRFDPHMEKQTCLLCVEKGRSALNASSVALVRSERSSQN